jgi:tRNA U34 5-methylaminomethyl-2-thiouridine-forming methyltransferase MnmC
MNSRKNKILKRKIILTKDGSHTIFIPELNENYHSVHGAEQESTHVFINAGLKLFTDIKKINILEIGFGTGLNALLTFYESKKHNAKIFYTSVEKYPITKEEADRLNYGIYNAEKEEIFTLLHKAKWNICIKISDNFYLKKINIDLKVFSPANKFNLIYFDAFAPDIQPKLWTKQIFEKISNNLNNNGVIVTYSVKGKVKRIFKSLNFKIELPEGPPGKRNMLRAIKTTT